MLGVVLSVRYHLQVMYMEPKVLRNVLPKLHNKEMVGTGEKLGTVRQGALCIFTLVSSVASWDYVSHCFLPII